MRWPWSSLLRPTRPRRPARRPVFFRPRLDVLEERCLLTAYVVTTTNDILNDTTNGELTLRDALTAISTQAASGNAPAGDANNTVNFAIGTSGSTQTINLTSALPALTHQVTLDGLTQGGASNTTPLIVLNGAAAGASADGLTLQAGSDGSTVRGLILQAFGGNGIVLNGTNGNAVTTNFIGTNAAGTATTANGGVGVLINASAKANTVGGTAAATANVISGNAFGVVISGTGTSGNEVEGNVIGLDKAGTAALGNTNAGVVILSGATANTVGGTTAAAANAIAATVEGVLLAGTGTSQNVVEGNFIGTDKTGTVQHGNAIGVAVGAGATANTVGGTVAGAGNVLSGNTYGVDLSDTGSNNNTVQGNLIGTDATGGVKLPNQIGVVAAFGASSNALGTAGAANVISANGYGLVLASAGTSNNVVAGNLIGTDKAGTALLGNTFLGVLIESGAASNTVGGTATADANVIGGSGVGVVLDGGSTTKNALQGNKVGTDATGAVPLANVVGVLLQNGAVANTVGGLASGAGNTIAFNSGIGVAVAGNATTQDSILSNSIFNNSGIGIDLGADGPTANGANPRTFPNDGQNFPTITGSGGNTVSGTLTSTPDTSFTVQYFGTTAGEPAAHQGQTFLGSDTVTTDASGNATFTSTISTIPGGDVLTATATNQSNGDTSEFS
jgi:hypothetical protein